MMALMNVRRGSEYQYAKTSMELTHRWLDRCLERFGATPDKGTDIRIIFFPIVQAAAS